MSYHYNPRTGLESYRQNDMTEPPPGFADAGSGGDGGVKEQPSIWAQYNRKAAFFDSDLIEDAKNTVEVLLIFAGLFSGVITAFLSQTISLLQPNPQDTMTAILNELKGTGSTTVDADWAPSHSAIRVNCFLVVGLFMSMLVALLAILVKEWVRSYQRDLEGVSSPHLKARIRHFRYSGVERWHFTHIVGLLSVFMNFALFVSAVGIIDLYLSTYSVVGYVAIGVFACGIILFVVTTLFPLFTPDAPFRTPFSILIMDINRSIYRRWKRRDNREKKEALEDYVDQSQGAESLENSDMRTKLHLDLDILSHLLGAADKSTERWILDMCFEKLPQLELIAKEDPSSILKRGIILEIYKFLASGCIVTNEHGQRELNSTRVRRANTLCKFIAWYLSLRRTPGEKANIERILVDQFDDPRELPQVIINDTLSNKDTVVAYSALGRLEHLYARADTPQCDLCLNSANILREKVSQQSGHSSTPQKADNAIVRDITQFLVKRTDCLLFWNWAEESDWQKDSNRGQTRDTAASEHLKLVLGVLKAFTLSTKDKVNLRKIIDEKRANAAKSLQKDWFEPLGACVAELPVRSRSPSTSGRPILATNPAVAAATSFTGPTLKVPTTELSAGGVTTITPAIIATPPPESILMPISSAIAPLGVLTPPAATDAPAYHPHIVLPPSGKAVAFGQDSIHSQSNVTNQTTKDHGSPTNKNNVGVAGKHRGPLPSKNMSI